MVIRPESQITFYFGCGYKFIIAPEFCFKRSITFPEFLALSSPSVMPAIIPLPQ